MYTEKPFLIYSLQCSEYNHILLWTKKVRHGNEALKEFGARMLN